MKRSDWCKNDCDNPCVLLRDIRIQYILRRINEQFPNKFCWRCEERQDLIEDEHEFASFNHEDGCIWLEFLYWSDSKNISLELCVSAESYGDIEETVLWELNNNEPNSSTFLRITDNILRRISAFIERGLEGFNEVEPPKYCLIIGDRIMRYGTADEAWENPNLEVRKKGSGNPKTLREFKARLDSGEELKYYAVVAYYEG